MRDLWLLIRKLMKNNMKMISIKDKKGDLNLIHFISYLNLNYFINNIIIIDNDFIWKG